ncbi:MAG: F0F1 ATP synthase subunit gamma [Legionellales bacterium]|nr:F0F1 ATP synthase subunit gamma [Legionellales bacterium]
MSAAAKIRSTIESTGKTRKVTSALEMVAASKLNKTQQRMAASRPYADKMLSVIGHLAQSNSEYRHPFLDARPPQRVGYIVISTDRGLCGGLNTNLFKETLKSMQAWQAQSVEVDVCVLGQKALSFFKRHQFNVLAQAAHLGDVPELSDVVGVVSTLLKAYDSGSVDRIFLASNVHVNTMTQKPRMLQLVPLLPAQLDQAPDHWDYIYEPDAKVVMDTLLNRYIECEVYQGMIENIACEQAARMMAMKNATDNAGDIIDSLRLAYNKVRQASITQELSEIVAGAEAV